MKHFLTALAVAGALFFAYLIGAFISVSFNPHMWAEELRASMALLGTIGGLATFGAIKNL